MNGKGTITTTNQRRRRDGSQWGRRNGVEREGGDKFGKHRNGDRQEGVGGCRRAEKEVPVTDPGCRAEVVDRALRGREGDEERRGGEGEAGAAPYWLAVEKEAICPPCLDAQPQVPKAQLPGKASRLGDAHTPRHLTARQHIAVGVRDTPPFIGPHARGIEEGRFEGPPGRISGRRGDPQAVADAADDDGLDGGEV